MWRCVRWCRVVGIVLVGVGFGGLAGCEVRDLWGVSWWLCGRAFWRFAGGIHREIAAHDTRRHEAIFGHHIKS